MPKDENHFFRNKKTGTYYFYIDTSCMKSVINKFLNLTDMQSNLVFLLIMFGGAAIIFCSFYFINVGALLNNEFLTIKEKIMGIGLFVIISHIWLVYVAKIIFKKIKNAKKIIDEKNEELQKMDEAKTEFIAMVIHELKTPLVPILSYASMLLQQRFGPLNDLQREKILVMISSGESLQSLIQNMLDLHKAALGKLTLRLESEDMQSVVQEAIAMIMPLANRRGIILDDQTTSDVKIMMDRRRILQVLTNLIKNAIDFVKLEEGVIQIQQELQSDTMVISIIDNGSGMPKEKTANLFGKFYQTDTSGTGGRDSSGLGLSICKMIVEQHGGNIWAESDVGKGLTIKIRLPLQKDIPIKQTVTNDVIPVHSA